MTVSFVLKVRDRAHTLYENPALPCQTGTAGGYTPRRVRFLFAARQAWRR